MRFVRLLIALFALAFVGTFATEPAWAQRGCKERCYRNCQRNNPEASATCHNICSARPACTASGNRQGDRDDPAGGGRRRSGYPGGQPGYGR